MKGFGRRSFLRLMGQFPVILSMVFYQKAWPQTVAETPKKRSMDKNKGEYLIGNKKIVERFYEIVFNGRNYEAIADFLKEDYIQHNPGVRTGREGFMSFIKEFHHKNPPDFRLNTKRMIAEDDYVVVHIHAVSKSAKLEAAVVDMYRIEDGKLAEHWDVIQPVPEESANNNTMF